MTALTDDFNPVAHEPVATLRDQFAMACDVSMFRPAETYRDMLKRNPTIEELASHIARIRYIEADAMMAARAGRDA
jgi:hypothetical protein